MTDPNCHPADRLADIRAEIAALREEEAELREGFISGELPLEGGDHIVVIDCKLIERIDSRAMREHVEESIWSPYLIATPTTYVTLKRKT
jgi:hypothetical protein